MAANEYSPATVLTAAGPSRTDRRARGDSPPAQSKRDKKRQHIRDKIAQLNEQTARDRDPQYREMLQKIQFDASLVSKFNPYADRALDEIEAEYLQSAQANAQQRSWLEMTGPGFEGFFHAASDCIEQKDFNLAALNHDYEKKSLEHLNTYLYKREVANREYKALASTIRERLINTISGKKFRLQKEKEAMEISDASALLLHPNQFSLTNPASPGGHNKRATRLRRDAEEGQAASESRKRKRNGTDDDGSPVPRRRDLDLASTTPFWQGDRLANRKVEGPIYSIDKLFTDKELSMTYNSAALAAHRFMLTRKARREEQGQGPSSGDSEESGNEADEQDGSDALPSAPMMERNMSRTTRSGGQNQAQANFTDNNLVGIEALANFEIPSNLERMIAADPKLPPTFPTTYVKGHAKISEYNTPTSLVSDDVSSDVNVMNVLRQYDQSHGVGANLDSDHGAKKILEAAAGSPNGNAYVAFLARDGPRLAPEELRNRLGMPQVADADHQHAGSGLDRGQGHHSLNLAPNATPSGNAAAVQALGGVGMSRQSSANGGTPMSRTSSRKGRGLRA